LVILWCGTVYNIIQDDRFQMTLNLQFFYIKLGTMRVAMWSKGR